MLRPRRAAGWLITSLLLAPILGAALGAQQVSRRDQALELAQGGRLHDAIALLDSASDANADELHLLGQLYLIAERRVEAEAALQRAVDQGAGSAPTHQATRLLGMLRLQSTEWLPAYLLLRPWVREHPGDLEARLAAAACAVRLGRLPDAEELLTGADDSPRARLLRGEIHLRRARPDLAAEALEPLAKDPSVTADPALDAQMRLLLGRARLGTQKADEAIALLDGRVRTAPMALLLSEAQYVAGELGAAVATLEPFAEENIPDVLQDLGRYLVLAGRHADAVPILERAVELTPEHVESWQSLGRALFASGRRDQATRAVERAKALRQAEESISEAQRENLWKQENPTEARLKEAVALRRAGDLEGALRIARQEISLSPDEPLPHLFALGILLELGRAGEALAAAEQGVRLAPERGDAYFHRGRVHLALGRTDAAEADFRRALEISPLHPAATNQLAVLLAADGRVDEARRLLEALLVEDPGNAVARDNLTRLDQGS